MSVEAIAVIGAGARYPGARDVGEFWHNLRSGVDGISRFSTAELAAAGVRPAELADPDYVPARGVVSGGEDFDWRFFGYSRAEARAIEPQQRLFLEICSAALDDAAIDPTRFPGWIGVYAGSDVVTRPAPLTLTGLVGAEKDFLATRVAYKLGLRGPAITVQTACSTSLVAIHQASQSLVNFECDAALAGGVSLWRPQRSGYRFQADSILSADGYCRSFDAAATGTVSSNGAGVVVLRRLSDALSDGDRILAVIRGSAVNNDGAAKMGFTAPALAGQRDVIRLALAQADADPADIRHVEAHGTATQLGDPIEVAALTDAFGPATDRIGYCALGSVKSNLGHTGAAAGVAGLLKTVLMLRHRELVPSLHFETANPKLGLESSPFRVQTRLAGLPADETVLAGVSSFGIGGTNAHAVLESAPVRSGQGRGPAVFCLSAASPAAAGRAATRLVERALEPDPVATAWTLATGRRELSHRTFLRPGSAPAPVRTAAPRRVGLLFPGQGALFPGAVEACRRYLPVFRAEYDRAAVIVAERWHLDLAALLAPGAEPAAVRPSLVQQLGLFSIGYALGRQLLDWGVQPAALLGHSAGEYAAAAVAGVWELAAGLDIVAERARAMRAGPAGGLLAVYAGPDALPPGHGLAVATEGPGQLVLAGPVARLHAVHERLRADGVEATVLDADRPFHTEAMRPATGSLRAALARHPAGPARWPVVSNLTGRPAERLDDPDYWADHLCRPVRLDAGMATVLAQGCDVVVELGPGRSMTGGLRHHAGWTSAHVAVDLIGRAADDREAALLDGLGTLWQLGVPVRWAELFDQPPVRIELPPVPLDSERLPEPLRERAAPLRERAELPSGPSGPLLEAPSEPPPVPASRPVPAARPSEPGIAVVGVDPAQTSRIAQQQVAAGRRVVGSHSTADLRVPLAGRLDWSGAPVGPEPELLAALSAFAAGLVRRTVSAELLESTADAVPARLRVLLAGVLAGPRPVQVEPADLDRVAGVRELLRHCIQSYPQVLAGRVEAAQVLFPDGSDERLRQGLTGNDAAIGDADRCLQALSRSVPRWAATRPDGVRVLEVGAGRGGLTEPLLAGWTERRGRYDVSDVSPRLVAGLIDSVAPRFGGVRGLSFDLNREPSEQGLVPGDYDLILAYNSVHVAGSVPAALAGLLRLLRPDGTLALIEPTRVELWQHLIWGLAPGWWDFADDLRQESPVLSRSGWTAALAAAGFEVRPDDGPDGLDHTVLVATVAGAERYTDPGLDLARQAPPVPAPSDLERVPVALPAPIAPAPAAPAPAPPAPGPADPLAELWCAALGVDHAGPHDDFFALGGESLGLVQLLGEVRRRTGVRVPMAEFLSQPRFAVLRDRLAASTADRGSEHHRPNQDRPDQDRPDQNRPDQDRPDQDRPEQDHRLGPNLIALAEGGPGIPLFLAAPGAGSSACYRLLAARLGGHEPVYGLDSPGLHDGGPVRYRIEEAAAQVLLDLRRVQPHGPYRLGGWSTGAFVAHELAARLTAAGDVVDQLVGIDGFVPRTGGRPVAARAHYLARGAWYGLNSIRPGATVLGSAGEGVDGTEQSSFSKVYRANVLAMLRYRPGPVDCPATILHTGLSSSRRRRLVAELAGRYRSLRLVGLPGDHHSVLRPPDVAQLADLLRTVLDRQPGEA